MDPVSLNSIGWLLPWGVALFAVMRFGCGAHIVGAALALELMTWT